MRVLFYNVSESLIMTYTLIKGYLLEARRWFEILFLLP